MSNQHAFELVQTCAETTTSISPVKPPILGLMKSGSLSMVTYAGEPQTEQKCKLTPSLISKRVSRSFPLITSKFEIRMLAFAENADPLARLHRKQ
jgi:hypothetical protein